MKGVALFFLATIAIILLGCNPDGTPTPKTAKAIEDISTSVSMMDPLLRDIYQAEQEACLLLDTTQKQNDCIDAKRATWKPVIEGLQTIRTTWCEVKPEACQ